MSRESLFAMEPEWTRLRARPLSDSEAAAFLREFLSSQGEAGIGSGDESLGLGNSGVGQKKTERKNYSPADTARLLKALEMDLETRDRGS